MYMSHSSIFRPLSFQCALINKFPSITLTWTKNIKETRRNIKGEKLFDIETHYKLYPMLHIRNIHT